jgi:hypothetical protein
MAFHEIAGLAVFAVVLIHCSLNWRWIAGIAKRLFDKALPTKTKLGFAVDACLLGAFLAIIASGILESQVVFKVSEVKGSIWRSVHHFSAGLSIALVGVHLGLHWGFVINMARKAFGISDRNAKTDSKAPDIRKPCDWGHALRLAALAGVLFFGIYSAFTTNFFNLLTAPFQNEAAIKDEGNSIDENKAKSDEGKDGYHNGIGSGTKQEPSGGDATEHQNKGTQISENAPARVMSALLSYISIIGVFAALAYYLEKLARLALKK